MNSQLIPHDERTVAVENESYRWGYLLMSFGLLAIVAYRGFVLDESSWDLLALVVLGGMVTTFYQGAHHVLSGRWAMVAMLTIVLAAVVAIGLVLVQ